MSVFDWIILSLFLLGFIEIVTWFVKRKPYDTSDYFLSGRRETCLAFGVAILAVNIGSEHYMGLAGAGAENGLSMAH